MSILPPNSTVLEKAVELLTAARLGDISVPLKQLWSPQDCPEELLPWLAWALSIDSWSSSWPLAVRRARVANAFDIQRRKGTVESVTDVVASFGGNVALREWFELDPPGEPHTFQLQLSIGGGGAAPTDDFIDAVIAEVRRTKPVRSHFTFNAGELAVGTIGLLGAARPQIYARLACEAV